MATIHNTDLSKELKEGAKLQQLRDRIPSELADKVVPVMEVNPKLLRRANIVRRSTASNATVATIYTTPSDKDFYLTGVAIAIIKDATSTSASSYISITIDGASQIFVHIPELTLTAQTGQMALSLPTPIKVDRGTAITINNSTNVANISATGTIVGYTVENINS